MDRTRFSELVLGESNATLFSIGTGSTRENRFYFAFRLAGAISSAGTKEQFYLMALWQILLEM